MNGNVSSATLSVIHLLVNGTNSVEWPACQRNICACVFFPITMIYSNNHQRKHTIKTQNKYIEICGNYFPKLYLVLRTACFPKLPE